MQPLIAAHRTNPFELRIDTAGYAIDLSFQ